MCVERYGWRDTSHIWVNVVVVDCLAPIRHQGICKHHADVYRSPLVNSADIIYEASYIRFQYFLDNSIH